MQRVGRKTNEDIINKMSYSQTTPDSRSIIIECTIRYPTEITQLQTISYNTRLKVCLTTFTTNGTVSLRTRKYHRQSQPIFLSFTLISLDKVDRVKDFPIPCSKPPYKGQCRPTDRFLRLELVQTEHPFL